MTQAYSTIQVDKRRDDAIAVVTLDRPERLNAISREMQRELAEAIEDIGQDDEMRVLVLTGAGRAFCSGADVGHMAGGGGAHDADQGAEGIRRGFRGAHRLILGLHRMEKPTIAMINGVAVGAGFDLACACDLRTGSPNSRFMVAFTRLGLFPGYGGVWLYARALGSIPKAAELLFTGDWLEAEDAHQHGLLNRLVPADSLLDETMALARRIAQGPPIALRLAKMLLYRSLEFDLETALLMSATAETITLTSQDHQEGVAAFREKRQPNFRGR